MVIDLNKEKISRCFLRSLKTYDSHATVQRLVNARLLGLLDFLPAVRYERVLEIGCCTGGLTAMLCKNHACGTHYLNDLVDEFYQAVRKRVPIEYGQRLRPLFGDIEQLALPDNLDLIISSSTFQWLADLPLFLPKLATALKKNPEDSEDSFLAFSIFGPGTLFEFKELTGVGLHYRPMEEIVLLLEKNFIIEIVKSEKEKIYFPTTKDILRHFQATGVGGVSEYRWSSARLKDFERGYVENFSTDEGLPLTYVSYYFVARKK